jgi:integrase
MSSKGVFKRCSCTEVVLDAVGQPVLDAKGKPKRRELGTGCPLLDKRGHGSWWYQVDVAPVRGSKRKRARRGGFSTKGEAEHARIQVTSKGRRAVDRAVPNDQIKVESWLLAWIDSRRKIRAATLRSYRGQIDNYLRPYLGHYRLSHLRSHHIRAMFDEIDKLNAEITRNLETNPRRRRGSKRLPDEIRETRRVAGPATQQRIKACLRKALADAVAEGLITTNPATLVELESGAAPKPLLWTDERVARWRETGEKPSRVMVWMPAQVGAFLDYAGDDRCYPLFLLVALCGLRRGEACGLRWCDLDLTRGTATISVQLTQNAWTVEEGRPKSDAGERVVILPTELVTLLTTHKMSQEEERAAWRSAWVDSGRVFIREGGAHLVPDEVSDRFRALVAECGLPPVTLHGLRHGAATYALDAGVDVRVVQEMLGHSSSVLTRDTYTSVSQRLQAAAAEKISGVIPRNGTVTAPLGSNDDL